MEGQYKYLSLQDRQTIERMYRAGARPLDIAAKIGVHTATIYTELQRGHTGKLDANQRSEYSAEIAQRTVQENFKRRGRRPAAQKIRGC